MKRTTYILTLLILTLISCGTDSVDPRFKREMTTLADLNNLVLENFNRIYKKQNIRFLKDSISNASTLVNQLEKELGLIGFELHQIEGDSSQIGIAYEFKTRRIYDIKYYMTYCADSSNSEVFADYPQFGDFRITKKRISPYWTYSEIHEYHD